MIDYWEFPRVLIDAALELDNERLGRRKEWKHVLKAAELLEDAVVEDHITDSVFFYNNLDGKPETFPEAQREVRALAARLRKPDDVNELRDLCIKLSRAGMANRRRRTRCF